MSPSSSSPPARASSPPATSRTSSTSATTVAGLYVRDLLDLFNERRRATRPRKRVDIESKGYTIIANIGNSATDLSGGHAEKTFKLPDYDGQLS